MHRTNVSQVSMEGSSQRSDESSFEKEDSPNLPVPPRRTMNTLSMLRKFFNEYDKDQSVDSARKKPMNYHTQQDANGDVPDHCWVGEYLDDEDGGKTQSYSSHISAMRGRAQNLPSSSGSTLNSFNFSNKVFSTSRDTYQTKSDDATDREIKELQRKEREKEQQLYKIMLESLEYKAELERLKREASLKKSGDSAKVFDYGHGTSDQSSHYPDQQYGLPHSSHQRLIDVPPEGRHSTFDTFHSQLGSRPSRKIVVESKKGDVTYNSPSNFQEKTKADMFELGDYGDRLSMTERTSDTFIIRGAGTDNVKYPTSSTTMSSFGGALTQTTKVAKKDTSQSYEDYLDEMQLEMQEEEFRGKSNQESEGLPISVLTSGERAGSGNECRSNIQETSIRTPPPLKIKPALKNIHKDALKKEMPGSRSLMESLGEMSTSSRLNLGNFNDTRKVMMEGSLQYDR